MKYKKEFLVHFKNFPLFTFGDVRLLLSKKGASADYTRKLVSNMVKRGELLRVTKGTYTLNRNPEVVGYAFRPFYYGLGSALNYYNLTEQQTNPTVITTRNIRNGVRRIFDRNVSIRRIPKRLYFGFDTVKGEKFYLHMSNLEKTLLDMLYFDYVTEDYVYASIFKRMNKKKMGSYLKKYSDRVKGKYTALRAAYG